MKIKKVGVIGCGFMGAGITQVCAQSGYQVTVQDINEDVLNKGLAGIDYFLTRAVEKGRLSAKQRKTILANITGTTDITELADSDIVVEVVPEDIKLKQRIFRLLDKMCKPEAILASNTSTIRIAELAKVTKHPERVIGTHFLSPVPPSKLLEIVKPDTTSDVTLEVVKNFGKSLGKEVIVTRDTPGFVFNYLLGALCNAALDLIENDITSAEDIDKSMTLGLGHPIGPVALMDFNGLDVCYLAQVAYYKQTKNPAAKPSKTLKKLVKEGNLGRKTGKGFYDYSKERSI